MEFKIIGQLINQMVNQIIDEEIIRLDNIKDYKEEEIEKELEKEFEKISIKINESVNIEPKVKQVEKIQQCRRKSRPLVKNNVTGKFDIKFASASLTFIHSKTGQLHCNEYRWNKIYEDGKNIYHLIGGKVEQDDHDILFTAIREFVEETNIFMDDQIIKNNEIKAISKKIYYQIKDKVKYYDIEVSSRGPLFHRCFTFNINKFTNIDLRKKILGLPDYYSKLLNPDIRKNKELNYLIWINELDKDINPLDLSSLLNDFNLNANKFV